MIHDITAAAPRNKRQKRKGRGRSSGMGKTAGRGTKGAGAHGGDVHWKPGHEGGQTPIHRRMPKRGFSNDNFERRFHIVNLAELEKFEEGTTVDAAALHERGLVKDLKQPVKILGEGTLSKKLTVQAGWFSKSAAERIAAAGGTTLNLKGEAFTFPKPTPNFKRLAGKGGPGAKAGKKKVEEAQTGAEGAAAPAAADAAPKSE